MTNQKNLLTVDEVKTQIVDLAQALKSVDGFDPNGKRSPMPELLKDFQATLREYAVDGRPQAADKVVAAGRQVLEAGRNILGAFLRHSVLDRKIDEDRTEPAFFTKEIAQLRDVEKFDPDLIEGLEKKRQNMLDAVKVEKNGTFTLRTAAYNALKRALADVVEEQRRRDRQPAIERAKAKQAKWAKEAADATKRNIAHQATARQQLIAQRLEEADKFGDLLK